MKAKRLPSRVREPDVRIARGSQTPATPGPSIPIPRSLTRSTVYKKVPVAVRGRLDEAILLRPRGCATLDAIAKRFQLSEQYGVSPSALRAYARRLEQFVRPAAASQVLASVLGCLPESYRRRLVAGSQVLLLSRVMQVLSADGGEKVELSVADLAKLASLLAAIGGPIRAAAVARKARKGRTADPTSTPSSAPTSDGPTPAPTRLAEAVRMLYGLTWPPLPAEQAGAGEGRGRDGETERRREGGTERLRE